jgi:ABC-2 type transport system ATP-binding protein
MSSILEVKRLTKRYKNSDFSLHDISLSIPKGVIMGFVGENGAGKTTTINCILGTVLRDAGSVKIFDQEFSDDSVEIRNDIGVVFDAGSFGSNLSADKVAKVMRNMYSNWDDALFSSYLDKFKLPYKKKIKTYSKGMTMKLGLAVALSHHPKLLILDEVTNGLDPFGREEVLDILLDFIQDENCSVLLSSHITSDLEKIADYITFIHNGKVVLCESKDNLIYSYGVIRCKSSQFEKIDKKDIIAYRKRNHQIDVLIVNKKDMEKKYRDIVIDNVSIEEIMIMVGKGEKIDVKE